MYHEKQKRMLCGVHAVNNLLQSKVYTKETFDAIAERLFTVSPEKDMHALNPHRSMFFGNYDANVVIEALNLVGFNTEWFPKTSPGADLAELFWEDNVAGIIINQSSFMGRHWTCLRKERGGVVSAAYHDSKCSEPEVLVTKEETKAFIRSFVANKKDAEFFVVRLNQS